MFDRGFFSVGTWRGIPVRLHWTAPLGALFFGGLHFAPVFWFAFFALIIVHELGHAYLVRRYRHHVMAIEVTGFGGLCRWVGSASTYERAAIAWGGVAAQALLLFVALGLTFVLGAPRTEIGAELASAFIGTNLWLIALNLLPLAPFDGAEAWPLARHLWSRWQGDRRDRRSTPPPMSRRSTPPPTSRRSAGESSSPVDPAKAEQSRKAATELADVLRRIGTDAGEARRGPVIPRPRSR